MIKQSFCQSRTLSSEVDEDGNGRTNKQRLYLKCLKTGTIQDSTIKNKQFGAGGEKD